MLKILLYIFVVLGSTIAGAGTGIGGSVIIKPVFDLINIDSATAIGVFSSIAVFTMSIVSIIKHLKEGFEFDFRFLFSIAFGSLLGGYLGERLFRYIAISYSSSQVQIVQSGLLLIKFILILLYEFFKDRIKHYELKNIFSMFVLGIFLGSISVFLGIGGGPLNVTMLIIFVGFTMKEAAVYSIGIIFFSQLSKLSGLVVSGNLFIYNHFTLIGIIVSAILGGYIGTLLNQNLPERSIEQLHTGLIVLLIFISIFNIYRVI